MCHISEAATQSLSKWAELEKRAAPLMARLNAILSEQKLIEEGVKAELAIYEEASIETDQATVVFVTRKGAVEWAKLAKDQGISTTVQDSFRKASTKAFTFRLKASQQEEAHENAVTPFAPTAPATPQQAEENADPKKRSRRRRKSAETAPEETIPDEITTETITETMSVEIVSQEATQQAIQW